MIRIYTEKKRRQIVEEIIKALDLTFKEHGQTLKGKSILKLKLNLFKIFKIKRG